MKSDRRNASQLDRRKAGSRDRRTREERGEDVLPAIELTDNANVNASSTEAVVQTVHDQEDLSNLYELTTYSRRESVILRERIVTRREDEINARDEIDNQNERSTYTGEILTGRQEEKLSAPGNDLLMHQQHNRQLVDANEQLIMASLQLQIAAEKFEKANEEMTHLAYHDALTNLPNRVQLYDRIEQAILFAKRRPMQLAILFLDLDRFKAINDSLGHATGDKLLQSVAQRLKNAVRDSDTVSRLGGDEFVLLLSEVSPGEGLNQKIAEIHKIVTAPYRIVEDSLEIGVTIGVSIFPDDGEDARTLIRNADAAMYHAKERGRNKYQYFCPAIWDCSVVGENIEPELRMAIERNELALCYQAQINLQSGAVTGVEALLRWHHPTRGLLLPGDFMPAAEKSGMIISIGQWVLREACSQAKYWLDHDLEFNRMAVNISACEFEDIDFLQNLYTILLETDLMPERLGLELNESLLMKSAEDTAATLRSLKSAGVKISIDDFGVGHSSLSYLRDFPIDTMKIDQSLV
jgi:diguanylate cyclase (GGDEF)-like protein